jgi:primase-polymerase (primpol)-like protein
VILLANQLAYMTNCDAVRIKRLLYQTGLVCEKWEEKRGQQTWIDYQIQDAISYVTGKRG